MLLVLLTVPRLGGYRLSGHVDRLITSHSGARDCRGKVVRVHPVSGSGSTGQENSSTPRRVIDSFSSTGVEEVAPCGNFRFFIA